jgi:hypothetical protein
MFRFVFTILLVLFFIKSFSQQWEKAKSFNNIYNNSKIKHVSDKLGNVYLVGDFSNDPLILDSIVLRTKGNLDGFVTKIDSNFNVIWAKSFGGEGPDMINGIAIDSRGNIIINGYFHKSMVIGDDTLKSIGLSDFFISKLNSDGEIIWANFGGSEYNDDSYIRHGGVKIDQDDNIFVAGMFDNESNNGLPNKRIAWFDTFKIQSFGDQDVFLAKYSANGKVLWVKDFGGYRDDIGDLFIDDKYIYLFGSADSRLKYESGEFVNPFFTDMGYIVKLDTYGQVLWVNASLFTEFGSQYISSLTTDSSGNIYATAMYDCISGRLKFDNYFLDEASSTNIFIVKLNRNGKVKWLKNAGGYANDAPSKILFKNNNHFIVTGLITGGGTYEGKAIISSTPKNTFILEIDSNGKPLVFEQCGNTGENSGDDISISIKGKLLITGDNWSGQLSFDSITCQNTNKPASFYIARRNFVPKPVGISKVLVNKSFKIYPNPNNGSFTIELENPEKDFTIEVFDVMGKLVKKVEQVGKVTLVALDVASGIYLVKVKNGELVWNQKMVLTN